MVGVLTFRHSQDLCQCLDVASSADPVPLCLTSEVLANPSQWWLQRVAADGLDPAMTDLVYLDIISRSLSLSLSLTHTHTCTQTHAHMF